jgi:hypothetical protein
MNEHEHTWLDIDEKAKMAGIDLPVTIAPALLAKLNPSPYLSSLGVALEQRVENLLRLLNAHLTAKDRQGHAAGEKYYLPFMILKGPLVAEAFFPVIAHIAVGENNCPTITLSEAEDTE